MRNRIGDSMLDLTEEEYRALIIVHLRCEVKSQKYGAAHHLNWKKVGLSRAYYAKERLREESMPTPRAAAASRFLLETNRFHAVLFKQRCDLLAHMRETIFVGTAGRAPSSSHCKMPALPLRQLARGQLQ